jgi:hypothetical protein
MSNKKDRSGNSSDDAYEQDTPRTFRDSYLNAANPNRSRSRSNDTPQNSVPETPDRAGKRARPARQSREEVYARLRRRPHQPIYARDQEETRAKPPTQTSQQGRPASRREPVDEYPYQQPAPPRTPRVSSGTASTGPVRPGQRAAERYTEYDEYDEHEIVQERRRRPAPEHRRKPTRGGRVFSTLLIGCLGSLLTLIVVAAVIFFLVIHNTPLGQSLNLGKTTYTQPKPVIQALTLGGATQLIVKNQAGNVSVNVDPNASDASMASLKKVQASSQSDANSQYNGITITTKQISQGGDPACTASSCLLITTTIPATSSGGLLGGSGGDSIDLTITLPANFNSLNSPSLINVAAPAGNIAVSGFNGMLNLTGNVGNITISHTLIYAGTCIQTMHGNVNVDQGSFFNLAQPSNLVPCSNRTSSGEHPWFNIRSSVGDVTVTLSTNSTNLLLDANTNNGKISDDFGLNIAVDGNSATYHNPLLPNTNPTASLYLFTSTGSIAVHRQ